MKNLPACTIRSIVPLPLNASNVLIYTFSGLLDHKEHLAIHFHHHQKFSSPLVRIHSECLTGDVLRSQRCDCGDQLQEAMTLFSRDGGILLYLRQEGRGIGLYNKLDAYLLQDQGHDTFSANHLLGFSADERNYDVAAQMLLAMEIRRIRLLSNNHEKSAQLANDGIEIEDIIQTGTHLSQFNHRYLLEKKNIAHHHLEIQEDFYDSPSSAN